MRVKTEDEVKMRVKGRLIEKVNLDLTEGFWKLDQIYPRNCVKVVGSFIDYLQAVPLCVRTSNS